MYDKQTQTDKHKQTRYNHSMKQKQQRDRENRSGQVAMRISPSLKAAAEQAAWEDRRTLSSWLEIVVETYLRERGLIQEEKGRRPKVPA